MSKYDPEYHRRYAEAHREQRAANQHVYYLAHRDELKAKKAEYQRAYYLAHREEAIDKAKAQYAADPVAAKARSRAWHMEHPLAQRGYIHKVGPAELRRMVMMSCGLCEICGISFDPPSGKRGTTKHAMTVDHNHISGAVRGLVCSSCNIMLARARDDPHVLEEAARYLAKAAA